MRVAFGGEVMTVTDDLELQRLLREAHDEAARGRPRGQLGAPAPSPLRACAAQTSLAGLPAEQLRVSRERTSLPTWTWSPR